MITFNDHVIPGLREEIVAELIFVILNPFHRIMFHKVVLFKAHFNSRK